jgi:hypothetical protein
MTFRKLNYFRLNVKGKRCWISQKELTSITGPVIMSVINHRQNPLDSTCFSLFTVLLLLLYHLQKQSFLFYFAVFLHLKGLSLFRLPLSSIDPLQFRTLYSSVIPKCLSGFSPLHSHCSIKHPSL